jgi:hypothetical protein
VEHTDRRSTPKERVQAPKELVQAPKELVQAAKVARYGQSGQIWPKQNLDN